MNAADMRKLARTALEAGEKALAEGDETGGALFGVQSTVWLAASELCDRLDSLLDSAEERARGNGDG